MSAINRAWHDIVAVAPSKNIIEVVKLDTLLNDPVALVEHLRKVVTEKGVDNTFVMGAIEQLEEQLEPE